MKTSHTHESSLTARFEQQGLQYANCFARSHVFTSSLLTLAIFCAMLMPVPVAEAQSTDDTDTPTVLGITWAQGSPEDQALTQGPLAYPYMTFHGGKIMPKANAQAIFWGTTWPSYTGDKITGMDSWYQGFGNSSYAAASDEYLGANGRVGPTLTYFGHLIDGSMASGGGNPSAILAEVCKEITSPDSTGNGYYPVYTDVPRGSANYCAYHATGSCRGIRVQYAFFFNLDGDPGCDPADSSALHSQGLAAISNVSGHELSEARTDPALNAWYDSAGNENGDKCAWSFGVPLVAFPNGTRWKIQGEWSNNAYRTGTGYPNRNGEYGCLSGGSLIRPSTYQYDDGTAENAIGVSPANSSVLWMNGFTVQPGSALISSISIAFGRPTFGGSNLRNGQPVTIYLWSDPNGDGDPSDARVLRSVHGVTANVDTNTVNLFPITPITLAVGSHFFVGAILTEVGMQVPGSIDLDQPMHNSFMRGWGPGITPDPNNIGTTINLDNTSVPGSFMIRAQ